MTHFPLLAEVYLGQERVSHEFDNGGVTRLDVLGNTVSSLVASMLEKVPTRMFCSVLLINRNGNQRGLSIQVALPGVGL